MEGLGWILFFILATPIALLLLFTAWLEISFQLENPNAVKAKPGGRMVYVPPGRPEPQPLLPAEPEPEEDEPGYVRKWGGIHERWAAHAHQEWQDEFDHLLKNAR